jgi:hypothetical protein
MARAKKTNVSLEADIAVLAERVNAVDEVRADVKSILSEVGKINVHLAQTPTWADLKAVQVELADLTAVKNKAVGGWKAIAALASVVGGLVSWLVQKVWP